MTPDAPVASPPSFAGVWRRVAAFLLDGLVLGCIGYALGRMLFDLFVWLGPWGRCVGFGVSLVYFVTQESGRGGGQSLGKRLLRIRVVDARGRTLSTGCGAARFAVLGVPYFLVGASLPPGVARFASGFPIAALALGGLLAPAYLLAFNRHTRQSLHDLATGAFVVRVHGGARLARRAARPWPGHGVIAGALVVLAGAAPLAFPGLMRLPLVSGVRPLNDRLAQQPELRTVAVFALATRTYGNDADGVRRELSIQATLRRPVADHVPLSTRIAGLVLASDRDAAGEDVLSVRLAYGFDIGIASSWQVREMALKPEQWADRVAAGVGG